MPRPPIKKTRKLAESFAEGLIKGEAKGLKHISILDVLKQKMLNIIDRLPPLETAMMIPTTYVVYTTLEKTKEITDQIIDIIGTPVAPAAGIYFPFPFQGIAEYIWNLFNPSAKPIPTPEEKKKEEEKIRKETMLLICVSIIISYTILFHPEVVTSILNLGRMLLGMVAKI